MKGKSKDIIEEKKIEETPTPHAPLIRGENISNPSDGTVKNKMKDYEKTNHREHRGKFNTLLFSKRISFKT